MICVFFYSREMFFSRTAMKRLLNSTNYNVSVDDQLYCVAAACSRGIFLAVVILNYRL